MDSSTVVVATDIGHRFLDRPFLFRHVSFTLEPDAVYALTGPSGSGKSTLLSILAGWLHPTEGRADLSQIERIGWVFQNPHGVARRTAVDHVALPFLTQGHSRSEAVRLAESLLTDFHLHQVAAQEFASLSGGEAQRLMLARAIAARPELLLVDEPTAQLDTATAAIVSQSLAAMAERGVIVVVATHDPTTRDHCTHTLDLPSLGGAHQELSAAP